MVVSQYQYITKQEFEEAINSYGLGSLEEWNDPSHKIKEYVYHLDLGTGLVLRIFSSIDFLTNGTREVGSDAIRIVPMTWIDRFDGGQVSYWKRLMRAQKRTYRVTNWRDNLYKNILEVIQKVATQYKKCDCGSLMDIREGKYGKFWGCLKYPLCKKTKKYEDDKK